MGHSQYPVDELIRKWGTSVSIALLDPACQIFRTPHVDGIIGYRVGKNYAVVLGDPICSQQNIPQLTEAFTQFCQNKKLKIVYTATSEDFKKWAIKTICQASLNIGEELILDPQNDLIETSQGRRLRSKLSQAIRAEVTVHEYLPHDEKLEQEIKQVGIEWLKSRKGPQIYLANVHLFENPVGKRWFYAKQNGKVIGVLLLNRIEARDGWLINLLLTVPNVPHGTTELLAQKTLEALKQEGCSFVTIGVVPGCELEEIIGFGKVPIWLAKMGFKLAKWFFDIDSSKTYWSKFHPQCERSYVLFSEAKINPLMIWDLFRALNASL